MQPPTMTSTLHSATHDHARAPVRSFTVQRMQARVQYRDYQIDPRVLAEAISERLCAGGLTTRLLRGRAV